MRRPLDLSIRSTSSSTCALVSTRLVSSCRPRRATKTRLGSLIHTSSTAGSSRNGWSGPNPATRATSSPTTAVGVGRPARPRRSGCARRGRGRRARRSGGPAGVALRVDALATDQLPDPRVEVLDQLDRVGRVRWGRRWACSQDGARHRSCPSRDGASEDDARRAARRSGGRSGQELDLAWRVEPSAPSCCRAVGCPQPGR